MNLAWEKFHYASYEIETSIIRVNIGERGISLYAPVKKGRNSNVQTLKLN